eukprot:13478677-Ditylum_brightwellii.AAC.1
MVEAIKCWGINGKLPLFGLVIDATKVSFVVEVSSGHNSIFGAEHPNQMIDIDGLSKESVRKILDGESKDYGELSAAMEIKVVVMTFQSNPDGAPPTEIIVARPQSNNESNELVRAMEIATSLA